MNNSDLDLYDLDIKDIIKNDESTDGNVYEIITNDKRYIAKIYNNLNHAINMINIHHDLLNNDVLIPSIIKTKDNKDYVINNNRIIVLYSYLEGIKIENMDFDNDLIIKIAQNVKKIHNIHNSYNLDTYIKDKNNKRLSLIHFDLTKGNILYNNGDIGFIDFDDAKYGESIFDVAITISFLFISKKRGFMKNYIKLFIDAYYEDDSKLKNKEVPKLKEYALIWLEELVSTHNFNSSLKESFEAKYNLLKENDLYE